MDALEEKIKGKLEESRHSEIVKLFKQLIISSKGDNSSESSIVKLIEKSNGNINTFLSEIKNIVNKSNASENYDNTNKVIFAVKDSKLSILEALNKQNKLLEQLVILKSADVEMTATGWDVSDRIKKVKIKTIIPTSKYTA